MCHNYETVSKLLTVLPEWKCVCICIDTNYSSTVKISDYFLKLHNYNSF